MLADVMTKRGVFIAQRFKDGRHSRGIIRNLKIFREKKNGINIKLYYLIN